MRRSLFGFALQLVAGVAAVTALLPVRSTPADAAGKWRDNLSASTGRIQERVQRVTVAPGEKAAAQADVWHRNVTAAKEKWTARVRSVSLESWKSATVEGANRVAAGASAKVGKVETFMSEFLPHLESGVAQIDRMPKGTTEDGINRAVAMIRHNAAFRRRGR